ncbi:uncharacterized protein M421DRAFT_258582 [Didymella exigua CBS 183.55]|uniref:Uncharacterized protein n=1 Tax=Didymella exigua CBS 183.55 TaxID=1150837 RepID=A0A6A5RCR7_9PLEO|nr:uncharacterized protein M421DRAFT_258582 [Didymella exigua CBS 183.55]KAF1925293.1 hypothetical protein M421DRAFT_258582 [Didymella exigua CBS 183.55]
MSSQSLQRDDSCPNGGVFYSCSQGFVGCCLVEACNPGVGCPPDKDRTPSESSSSSASTTISVLTSSATPSSTSASFSTNAASFSIPTSRSSASDLATSISGVIATESPKPSHLDDNSVPTAALVGAVLGGVILIAMIAGLVLYLRHRKRTKVYKAAVYPSPHVGCDMSPQLPGKYIRELESHSYSCIDR